MRIYFYAVFVFLGLVLFSGCNNKDDGIKSVAFISLSDVDDKTFEGFKEKMKEFGWEENKNINYIVSGAAKNVKNLPDKVKSIIDKKPDMIFVSSTPATQEVKKQNKDIPVVFCPVNDPVGAGILKDTNAPEGLITGVRLPVGDFKRTEWLYQISPNIKNVFVPFTKDYQSSLKSLEDMKQIAKELNFNIVEKALLNEERIDSFISEIPSNIDAVLLPRDSIIESAIEKFVKYSLEKKIPLSAPSYQQVQKGALFTYGFIHYELGKDAALMADKILRGVKVKDLPVKFGSAYLVLNQATADKIGLTFNEDTLTGAKIIIK